MGNSRKFSDLEMAELADQGLSVTEMAQHFGVNKSSVSKRLKKLNFGIAKDVTLVSAGEIVRKRLNLSEILTKQWQEVNAIQVKLMAVVEAGSVAGREELLAELRPLLGDKSTILEVLRQYMAETRQTIKLFLDAQEQLVNMGEIADFQRVVLEAIDEVAPEVREEIVKRLVEASALRSALGWH